MIESKTVKFLSVLSHWKYIAFACIYGLFMLISLIPGFSNYFEQTDSCGRSSRKFPELLTQMSVLQEVCHCLETTGSKTQFFDVIQNGIFKYLVSIILLSHCRFFHFAQFQCSCFIPCTVFCLS